MGDIFSQLNFYFPAKYLILRILSTPPESKFSSFPNNGIIKEIVEETKNPCGIPNLEVYKDALQKKDYQN